MTINRKKDNAPQRHRGVLRALKAMIDRNRLGELLVLKGLIQPQDLKFALALQKHMQVPLGQVLVASNLITQRQLTQVLLRQYCLRVMASLFLMYASFCNFTSKRAQAETIKDVPAMISVVPAAGLQNFGAIQSYPGLFGSDEKESDNLQPFTKWTMMFDRFETEIESGKDDPVLRKWQASLKAFENMPLKSMAEKVNKLVNRVKYVEDTKNWGKGDYWATPVEFLKNGGDCEDYAIAKYTALRTLGVPEERLRIAIVQDTYKNIPHAVLAVYTDEGTYVLDNQNKELVDGDHAGRYRPIFSINRQAWWLHTKPSATFVAAR